MKKRSRRAAAIMGICAVLVAAFAGVKFWRDASVKVSVVSVSSLNNGFWGEQLSTSGLVYDTNNQSVYPASTQVIQEVFVTQGQEVKAGDKLMSYDMTSEQLTLQSKQVALEQAEQAIKNANAELYKLLHTTPAPDIVPEPVPEPQPQPGPQPEPEPQPEKPQAVKNGEGVWNILDNTSVEGFTAETPSAGDPSVGEAGSISNPRVYKIAADDYLVYGSFYNALMEASEGSDSDLYFRTDVSAGGTITQGRLLNAKFLLKQDENRKWNKDGEIDAAAETRDGPSTTSGSTAAQTDGSVSNARQEPQTELQNAPAESAPTQQELASRIQEVKNSLPKLDLAKRKAALELRIQEGEMVDGIVYAKSDGIVKTVGDPASPPTDGSAFLVVAAGGGTTIQGTVSELMLDQIAPGKTLTCTSWDSGNTYTATVQSIDTYPTTDENSFYGGNPNNSTYYFYAAIEGESDLKSGSSLELSFDQSDEGQNMLTISKAYVRNDASGWFVMKRGEDGRLMRQNITTGKIYFGEIVEIKEGLTSDDFIAFPYGDGAREGSKTTESEEVPGL